ncbi:hypothetical protein D3C71_2013820 [compost metagenome]
MNSNSIGLSELNSYPYIFITGNKNGISNRVISCKLNHIGHDHRIDPLLLTVTVEGPHSYLYVIASSQGTLIQRRAAMTNGVVPINS